MPSLDCNVIIEFVTFTKRLYDVHKAVSDCFSGNEKGQIHVQLRTQTCDYKNHFILSYKMELKVTPLGNYQLKFTNYHF